VKEKDQKHPEAEKEDPLFGLKYIAWCRSQFPPENAKLTDKAAVDFARHQICKVRNKLFNDPIFDTYTREEFLIEYFAIRYDEDEEIRKEFAAQMVGATLADHDWFDKMQVKYISDQEKQAEESTGEALQDEVEETFNGT